MRDEEVIKLPPAEKFPRAGPNVCLPVGHVHQGEEAASKRVSVRNRTLHSETKFQTAEMSEIACASEGFKQSGIEKKVQTDLLRVLPIW